MKKDLLYAFSESTRGKFISSIEMSILCSLVSYFFTLLFTYYTNFVSKKEIVLAMMCIGCVLGLLAGSTGMNFLSWRLFPISKAGLIKYHIKRAKYLDQEIQRNKKGLEKSEKELEETKKVITELVL